ncbi:hypothetical protein LIA77_03122 [Sarocladium implicatum]|jgi:hypothetical protein|nr:hypothetical protein LIA77_03122 [Sarocladium implicatum]
MSFSVIYCPATIEVGQSFEITLSNTHMAHGSKIQMQVVCDNDGERRVGLQMVHFDGQDEMSGNQVSQPRFAFHPLIFLEGSEDKTWTIEFRLIRSYPYDDDDINASCRIRVLPTPEVDGDDVKPHSGVYRQITPEGFVDDSD